DAADPFDRANVVLSNGSLIGLSPAAIYFTPDSVNALTVNGGSGNNAYTVNNPQGFLSDVLNTGDGTDTVAVLANYTPLVVNAGQGTTVTVGNAGLLTDIRGDVTVAYPSGFGNLVIDDSADPADRTVTLDTATV